MSAEQELSGHPEVARGKDVPNLKELFDVFLRGFWLIVLTSIVFAGGAVGFSIMSTPSYEASSRILIGSEPANGSQDNSLQSQAQGLQLITQTMTEAINSDPIIDPVIKQLSLHTSPEDFRKNLTVNQVKNTQFIQVVYTDTSPERAQQVANAVGDSFSEHLSEVNPYGNAITATVWERAKLPNQPVSPKPLRNGLVALAAGVLFGVALVFLLEYLYQSRRSPRKKIKRTTSRVPNSETITNYAALKRGEVGAEDAQGSPEERSRQSLEKDRT